MNPVVFINSGYIGSHYPEDDTLPIIPNPYDAYWFINEGCATKKIYHWTPVITALYEKPKRGKGI